MDFLKIIPLLDFEQKDIFAACRDLNEFLEKIIFLAETSQDLRTQQACLSVYMAFRDHYPSYLKNIPDSKNAAMNKRIDEADSKIIKLRRIALAELAKVA